MIKNTRLFVGAVLSFTAIAALGRTASAMDQPYVWRNVKIVAGGFVPGIVFSPKQPGLAYARMDIGGVYRWDAADKHWTPLTDWAAQSSYNLMGGESVAPDPRDANKLYIAAGMYSDGKAAILRSSDQGKTFDIVYVPFSMGGNEDGRGVGERLDIDPNDTSILYFASRRDGLWSSHDSAKTWTKVAGFPISGGETAAGRQRWRVVGLSLVVFDPTGAAPGEPSKNIYVGVGHRADTTLYRSTDSGNTWEPVPGQPKGLVPIHAELDSDGMLYLAYGNGAGPNDVTAGAVYKFDTRNGTWTDITPEKGHFGYAGLSIDRQHRGTLAVTTIDRWDVVDTIFRTTDGGRTWKSAGAQSQRDWSASPYVTFGLPVPKFGWWTDALAIDPFDSNHVCYGTGATIWATDDFTNIDSGRPTHWSVWGEGIEETAVIDLISPPQEAHLVSALGDIGGFVHNDLAVSPPGGFLPNPQLSTTTSLDFAENNPAIIVRIGEGERGKSGGYSLDGGATWKPFTSQPRENSRGGCIAVSADGRTFIWAPQREAPVFSKDHGATWTPCKGLFENARPISDRVDPARFYAMDFASGKLYLSTDGGASFASHDAVEPGQGDNRLRALPGREGDLWLVHNGGLYHSTDGGGTFARLDAGDRFIAIGFGKPPPDKDYPALYTAGVINGVEGIFRSDDMGSSWVRISDQQHQYGAVNPVIGDPRIFGRVYIGTNGRGVLYGDPQR